MLTTQTYISNTLVKPGAVITSRISTDEVLGRTITAGGRCESMQPERWVPVVCNGNQILWEGGAHQSSHAAAETCRSEFRPRAPPCGPEPPPSAPMPPRQRGTRNPPPYQGPEPSTWNVPEATSAGKTRTLPLERDRVPT